MKERKIAIFTDAHSPYEPTLAILKDIKKEGIKEIYSLGDNIGIGPKPKEVMDLLEEYNVKSVLGNHEIYAVEGIESLYQHLVEKNAVREAQRNGDWTYNKITEEQQERIRLYPKTIKLKVGGKKIVLCHSIKDLNNGRLIVNPNEFDLVLQGHIHFKKEEGNIKTLSGVGIGDAGNGKAIYIVIVEKENGYIIEEKEVEYNIDKVRQNIDNSDLCEKDKFKAYHFAKVRMNK